MTSAPIDDRTAEVWRRTDAAGFLREWAADAVPGTDHGRHTGLRIVEVPEPGTVVMSWLPGPQLGNMTGVVHGGYVSLVCDEAGGLAAASTGERFVPMLTLDLAVTYVRPSVLEEEHRVVGQVLHAGRSRVVADVTVTRPDGRLAASARGSFLPNRAFLDAVRAGR